LLGNLSLAFSFFSFLQFLLFFELLLNLNFPFCLGVVLNYFTCSILSFVPINQLKRLFGLLPLRQRPLATLLSHCAHCPVHQLVALQLADVLNALIFSWLCFAALGKFKPCSVASLDRVNDELIILLIILLALFFFVRAVIKKRDAERVF
jgi:hypothetical protein